MEYEFEIDASTGTIIEWSAEHWGLTNYIYKNSEPIGKLRSVSRCGVPIYSKATFLRPDMIY